MPAAAAPDVYSFPCIVMYGGKIMQLWLATQVGPVKQAPPAAPALHHSRGTLAKAI
jgi:hypothetical protein